MILNLQVIHYLSGMKNMLVVGQLLLLIVFSGCSGKSGISDSPEKLEVSTIREMRIRQRETLQIKGTGGDVALYLGDITHGACQVEIRGRQNEKEYVYLNRSLREHDSTTFAYYDRFYRIIINGFELHFIHDDFAFLTVREITNDEAKADARGVSHKKLAEERLSPEQAMDYLAQIEKSNCTFIRDGKSRNAHDFFGFLAAKYAMYDRDIRTKSDFQRYILTRSDETGEPYKVVTEKGDTVLLNEWMKW